MTNSGVRPALGGAVVASAISLVGAAGCPQSSPSSDDGNGTGGSGIVVSATDADSLDGGTTGTTVPTMTGECADLIVKVDPITPTIMLVVDQSGSMDTEFGDVDRWEAVYDTLMNPADGVVQALESQVRFGLALYSNPDGECPTVIQVPPKLNNRKKIDNVYAPERPDGDTPTGEALDIVTPDLAAFPKEGPKAIVLCTDGEPDTCEQPNPNEGQPEALAAAKAAFEMDIETFIISVGDEVGEDHLQQMANVGVGKKKNAKKPAPYYVALDAADLVVAFEEIIGGFISCTLEINGEVDVDEACDGTVLLDGEELVCGTDWEIPDPTTLEILGDACDKLQDGDMHTVEASFPCGVVNIP